MVLYLVTTWQSDSCYGTTVATWGTTFNSSSVNTIYLIDHLPKGVIPSTTSMVQQDLHRPCDGVENRYLFMLRLRLIYNGLCANTG